MAYRLPKVAKILPGHEEQFKKAIEDTMMFSHGVLGWSGQAWMFVELGLDRALIRKRGKRWPNKRIRRKLCKAALKRMMIREVFSHTDILGFVNG